MYANADGSVLPCCIAEHHQHMGNTQKNSIKEIWNSSTYKQLRTDMLSGQRATQCSACYRSEDQGSASYRTSVNQQFAEFLPYAKDTNPDGSLDYMNLHYFDVRWSNICNFKCRTCSSTYSSSWAKEDGKKEIFIYAGGESNDKLYNEFMPHFKNMKEIYFAGGEPLLTEQHYQILDHLISIGKTDVKLRYNTNLSKLNYKQTSVLDYWTQFKNVTVFASLDSWGGRAEYIREGTDWTVIEKNIKTIKTQVPNVILGVSSVISVFNIATVKSFLDTLIELLDAKFTFSCYNIINPDYYSMQVLPNHMKKQILDDLRQTTWPARYQDSINSMITNLENSQFDADLHAKFVAKTNQYDTLRHRKFTEVFPELKQLIP